MIDISALREDLAEESNWVMFDSEGNILDVEMPSGAGPATLIVVPVTDAVKTVEDDRVTGSIDRSQLWRVEAFLLNRIVLDELGTESVDVDGLFELVEGTGTSWQVVGRPSPA